jgi:alpha-galactosidase/6-phospho-beta-glucosidase family protein
MSEFSSTLLHPTTVTFGDSTMCQVELIKVFHCSHSSIIGLASLRVTGLNHIANLKQVWLTGFYDEDLKMELLKQLGENEKKLVLSGSSYCSSLCIFQV